MNTIHRFRESIKIGDLGEQDFIMEYGFTKAKTYDYDFHSQRGVRFELKTDQYRLGDRLDFKNKITNNYFMERYIVQEDGSDVKDGGPWTAYYNADYFIYYFRNSQVFFVFEVKNLVARLNTTIVAYNLKLSRPIWNDGYYAQGYKVPITALHDIAKDFTFADKLSKNYFNDLGGYND